MYETLWAAIPAEAAFETSPTIAEVPIHGVPDGEKHLILGVYCMFHTLPVDGSNNVAGDLEHVDASDSYGITNRVAAWNFLVANTAMVARKMCTITEEPFQMDGGDTLNFEMDITTPDTAGAGACFFVKFRILSEMKVS